MEKLSGESRRPEVPEPEAAEKVFEAGYKEKQISRKKQEDHRRKAARIGEGNGNEKALNRKSTKK